MIDIHEMNAPLPYERVFELSLDSFGRLVLTDSDGVHHAGVEPIRGFPIGEPARFVSIVDSYGHEIAFVDDLVKLPPATRAVLERELNLREFVPVITKIMAISGDGSAGDWEVETNHGKTRFRLEDEEDIRRIAPHQALVTDSAGVRYLIADTRTLEPSSRRLLDKYL